jgi:signal transduction histidine kinase
MGQMHSGYPKDLHDLNIILKISQGINSTLDYNKVLQLISNGMSELLEIETAAVYLFENEQQIYLGATTPPFPPSIPDILRRANIADHPHITKVVETHMPIVITDTQKAVLSPSEREIIEIRNLKSILFLPFVSGKIVLGVLILGTCNKIKQFTQHEIDVGQLVANQFSVAVQNARFHLELKRQKEKLEEIVIEKTKALDDAIDELKATNEELYAKNERVNNQYEELEQTMNHLKETQSQLVQAEKMASLGILTAGVAHEINNPLNFIMGAYIGLENYFNDKGLIHDKHIQVYLKGLKTGLENASKIVQGLSQFSRDSEIYNEDCDIHAILDNCLLMLKNQLKHRVHVTMKAHEGNVTIKGNVGKLHQVFLNILANASQAIEETGDITIVTSISKNKICVVVEDTGIGIEKHNLSRITDPFYTTKEPGQGVGLGLSITYTIIKDHKGNLEFDSEPGKGTTVKVTLPINHK